VIVPKVLSGIYASEIIEDYVRKPERMDEIRDKHVRELERIRQEEILGKYEVSLLLQIEEKEHEHHYQK